MNLIVEAGGTKTNLLFIETGEVVAAYEEIGLHVSREPIDELKKRLVIWNELGHGNLQSIYLFAAGRPPVFGAGMSPSNNFHSASLIRIPFDHLSF